MSIDITGASVLVTGTNRGIGAALVADLLSRGAARVYAAARRPVAHPDPRVTPLTVDITDDAQVARAVAAVGDLDILINNAGVQPFDDLSDPEVIHQALAVNLFGTHRVTQAFTPALVRSRGTVLNILSLAALSAVPFAPAYSISKAAALSLTQAQRALLGTQGVTVLAVLAGPVDTEMTTALEIPKAAPDAVAAAVLDGLARGDEESFPDAWAATLEPAWRDGAAKQFERQNAALLGSPMEGQQEER